jgi:hypothetical protein
VKSVRDLLFGGDKYLITGAEDMDNYEDMRESPINSSNHLLQVTSYYQDVHETIYCYVGQVRRLENPRKLRPEI